MNKEIQRVVRQMSSCGAQHRPFLFAFDFELSEAIFVERPVEQQEILFRTPQGANYIQETNPLPVQKVFLEKRPLAYEEYRKKFDIVRNALYRGDSFLTNLTVKTPIETSFSLKEIVLRSTAPYNLYVPERFVCFSPERFVRIADLRISTDPMKGTIDINIPNAGEKILNDEKEMAEHNTVVDLLRNDIGIIAEDISVDRFRYLSEINTRYGGILQVSSEISGRLSSASMEHLGEIMYSMLPAGSVSGAPKKSTVEIIRQAEEEPRSFYSGVFGYYDGETLDSAVLIRFIEIEKGKTYFRSGGGITVMSDPRSEYEEVIEKIYLPFI